MYTHAYNHNNKSILKNIDIKALIGTHNTCNVYRHAVLWQGVLMLYEDVVVVYDKSIYMYI